MIVVSGVLGDEMIELMCSRLNDMGYEYIFLDELHFPGKYNITWELSANAITGQLVSPTGKTSLEAITGVYARYVGHRDERPRDGLTNRETELVKGQYQLSLMQLFDLFPCTVVNRVKASTSNDSKLYQQLVIRSFGFCTPRTLVTTIPEEVQAFYEACEKRVIYKSLSSVRSIVRRLDESDWTRLGRLRNCPTQFQEAVAGVDIRVHTVGADVFATQIVSEASDYRYARQFGTSYTAEAVQIRPEIADACVSLAGAFGLEVAGVDLRRTPDDRYYCFEVNPSPAFVFYERAGGQPISKAVANLLRGRSRIAEQGCP